MTSLLGPDVSHVRPFLSVVGSIGLVVAAFRSRRYPGVEVGVKVLPWMSHWAGGSKPQTTERKTTQGATVVFLVRSSPPLLGALVWFFCVWSAPCETMGACPFVCVVPAWGVPKQA